MTIAAVGTGCSSAGGSPSSPPVTPAFTSTSLALSSTSVVAGNMVSLTARVTWGATNLGPAAIGSQVTAWIRIARRNMDGTEHYTAYSSNDGVNWVQGGTWVHSLAPSPKICLYAGNRAGFTATFHYVHVTTLH